MRGAQGACFGDPICATNFIDLKLEKVVSGMFWNSFSEVTLRTFEV
jgi:hypothetical protein